MNVPNRKRERERVSYGDGGFRRKKMADKGQKNKREGGDKTEFKEE